MRTRPTVLYFAPADRPPPALVAAWAGDNGFRVLHLERGDAVGMAAVRSLPFMILVADETNNDGRALCRTLKGDPFTGVIPLAVLANRHEPGETGAWFDAGADEVISPLFEPAEQRTRLDVLLARTQTQVSVHPSTRLAGTTEIERVIRLWLERERKFAVCYADLDHFKEYNDRYSWPRRSFPK